MDCKGFSGQGTGWWASGESKAGRSPIKFGIVCFEPVCSEDDIVGANIGNVEFRTFLVVMFVWSRDAYGLDGSGAYWTRFVGGAVNIFDG